MKRLFLLLFLLVVAGCAHKGFLPAGLPEGAGEVKSLPAPEESPPGKTVQITPEKKPVERPAPESGLSQENLKHATEVLHAPKTKPLPGEKKIPVEIDLEEADLLDFLDLLFKETLKVNYVVNPQARAKITAHIKGEFRRAELLDLVRRVLELQGISVVNEGDLLRVVPTGEVGRLSRELNFLLLKPRYLQASQMLPLVRLFTSRQGVVQVERQANILIVVDNPLNLSKIRHMVSLLDESFFQDFIFDVYEPQVLSAEKLAGYLQKIFRSRVLKGQGLDQYIDFVPIKELDALVILARYPDDIARARRWLRELDSGEVVEEQVFVYPVENGEAEEIANILRDIFSEGSYSRRETIIRALKTKTKGKKTTTGTAGLVSGKIKIVPDKVNNLLVIRASREDYEVIEGLLHQLDVMPRQVLIEVLIAEVALNRSLEFGVEWFINTQLRMNGKDYPGRLGFAHKGAAPAAHGQDTTFTFVLYRYTDLRFLLKALDSVSDVRVLSAPVLLASNGKEAFIQIGSEVPIVSREVANTGAETPNVTRSIQYRDTGIILKVKPFINSSGLVKLDVEQEVSQAHENYLGLDSPLFSKRKIVTSLVVKDRQTIILGGLIDNKSERGEAGIPFFRSLPGIGGLFRWRTHSAERTELMVAITPRVVRSIAEAEEAMKEYRQRIEDLKRRLKEL